MKRYHKHRSFFEIFEPANRDLFFLGPGFWGKMSSFVSDFATIMQLMRKQTPGLWLWKMSIWILIQSCTSPQLSPCWEPSFRRFASLPNARFQPPAKQLELQVQPIHQSAGGTLWMGGILQTFFAIDARHSPWVQWCSQKMIMFSPYSGHQTTSKKNSSCFERAQNETSN